MIAKKLAALLRFHIPASGDCSGLLDIPGAIRFKNLAFDDIYLLDSAIADAEADLVEGIAPCEICDRDTYFDIVVAWVRLAIGSQDNLSLINGYRLCDICAQQALTEDKVLGDDPEPPFIDKMVLIHRTNDKGETATDKEWRELTATHCGFLGYD